MEQLPSWLQSVDPALGYLLLALGATIEYVAPPFPGDTVVVLGAILIEVAGWSLPLVLLAATLGSVLGAALNLEAGRWLGRADRDTWLHRRLRGDTIAPRLAAVRARFERHGAAYVAINRFLPGVRSLIFVAAGLSDLPRLPVLAWAALSALLWNAGLVALGHLVGYNFERLLAWVQRYTTVAWIGLGVVALVMLGRALHTRRSDDPP